MSMMQPNPGAVSGPASYSERTDLPPSQGAKRLPDAAYGEQKQFQADQAGAPMAKARDISEGVIPLGAETRRPDEFVTAGVNAGPGPGREVLGLKSPVDSQIEDLTMLAKYMPLMSTFADSPNSTGTMKAFVKYLKSQTE
jgi:hypothetical protein